MNGRAFEVRKELTDNMGLYLNPGNESFRQSVTDEIYIDKTAMISLINKKLNKSRTKYSGKIRQLIKKGG